MSTLHIATRPRRDPPPYLPSGSNPEGEARIGPNAVTRTLQAARELHGEELANRISAEAALPESFPPGLIPEAWFIRVVAALRRCVPGPASEAVLALAGAHTARYVAVNRVPAPFRVLLGVLPARFALPLLVRAFRSHSWTFTGGGRFRREGPYPGTLVLEDAPTCRAEGPTRSGAYYEAAFQHLLGLAAPGIRVIEVTCQAGGASACRFQLQLEAPDPAGDRPCASS